MKIKLISTFCLIIGLNLYPLHVSAMGNKDAAQEKDTKVEIKGSKEELARKFIEISRLFSSPDLKKLTDTLEPEFKAIGFPSKPFDKTLTKVNEFVDTVSKPILTMIQQIIIKVAIDRFSESELKELIEIYQKPVMQKQSDFMLNWIMTPVVESIKDTAQFQKYTQEFLGMGLGMAMQYNPQALAKTSQELIKELVDEIESIRQKAKWDSPEFKDKLKERYKAIATFIDAVDFSKIGDDLKALSSTLEKGNLPIPGLSPASIENAAPTTDPNSDSEAAPASSTLEASSTSSSPSNSEAEKADS